MRGVSVKWIAYVGWLLLALCVGGEVGVQYERWSRTQPHELPPRLANESADMALAVAEKGNADQATILMRRAVRRANRDLESYYYLWNATQEIERRVHGLSSTDELRQALLSGLDAAMLDSESVDDFGKLYKLRLAVVGTTVPKTSSGPDVAVTKPSVAESLASVVQTPGSPPADAAAIMRAGLQLVREGDEDRAEFLTQAALKSQAEHPNFAPALWSEYKSYLEADRKLPPYDRLARLSAYMDSIDAALLACRNITDFQCVWAVRQEIDEARSKSHADLQAEVATTISDLRDKLTKGAASGEFCSSLRLIASHAEQLKPKARNCSGYRFSQGTTCHVTFGLGSRNANRGHRWSRQ